MSLMANVTLMKWVQCIVLLIYAPHFTRNALVSIGITCISHLLYFENLFWVRNAIKYLNTFMKSEVQGSSDPDVLISGSSG